jgi:Pentapeptide repeats (8 copies)
LAGQTWKGQTCKGRIWRRPTCESVAETGANLQGADLTRAYLLEAHFPAARLQKAVLREADFEKANLSGADLSEECFPQAKLQKAELIGTDLRRADLQRADLRSANLDGAKLREADLKGADLSTVEGGLRPEQLAGADLTGAKLPPPIDKLFGDLDAVKGISESARKLFVAMLVACFYSWLTIAATTDLNLITNRASSPLPIIQTSIPIVGFYVAAPLILLCVYFYFHFYLQNSGKNLAHCRPSSRTVGRCTRGPTPGC